MSTGKTVQIIGAVVDVVFSSEAIPKIYDALIIDDAETTLEVQQQLGDGVVRTIAMGSSEGLKRGMSVSNTGGPISVPVGEKTLGRIMDVLGKPIDNAGDIGADTYLPIHRKPPSYEEQAPATELLETGIKWLRHLPGIVLRLDLHRNFLPVHHPHSGHASSSGRSFRSRLGCIISATAVQVE